MTEKLPFRREVKMGNGDHIKPGNGLSLKVLKAVVVYGPCAGSWHWVLFLAVNDSSVI